MNQEIPDVQAGFRKGRGTRDQIANICWIIEKAREFQKNIYFCFIDYIKAFDCVCSTTNGKILKSECRTTLPASWGICMQVKKQQLELNMEQWTGSKLGKECVMGIWGQARWGLSVEPQFSCFQYVSLHWHQEILKVSVSPFWNNRRIGEETENLGTRQAQSVQQRASGNNETPNHFASQWHLQKVKWDFY